MTVVWLAFVSTPVKLTRLRGRLVGGARVRHY
jgi:hypothetical protein